MVRWAPFLLLTLLACNDLREFRGQWRGTRTGSDGDGSGADVLKLNVPKAGATLAIDGITSHHLDARLAIDGMLPETPITSLDGAEADALADLTFAGNPLRVYLAFVAMPDGGGEALVVVALYDDRRVEVRLLRGGTNALYGIFALTESAT